MNEGPELQRSKRSRILRWIVWLALLLGLAVALFWVADRLAESFVRGQLDAMAGKGCAVIDGSSPPQVEVDLFEFSVQITGVSMIPALDCSNAALQFSGALDTVLVTGMSLHKALFRHILSAERFALKSSGVRIFMRQDRQANGSTDMRPEQDDPWSFEVSSIAIDVGPTTFVSATGDSIGIYGKGLALQGSEMRSVPDRNGAHSLFRVDRMRFSTDSINAVFASGYSGSIRRCVLDQEAGAFSVHGGSIGPQDELEEHSKELKYETDVIKARIDTLALAGLDLNAALAGVISIGKATIVQGDVTVLRDKTLQDGPSVEQVLLARLVRKLPEGSRVDTILVAGLDVRYRERADHARGYAVIPFGQVSATITGVRNILSDTSAMVIRARCAAFDDTPVSLVLRTVVQDTMDRFELDASIGKLSFLALNKVTGPLMDVRSTSGHIDTVIMHMDADKRSAKGMVRMAYNDLKLASGGRKRKEAMNRIETMALNTLVQNDNRDKGGPRPGPFAFERRLDRAVFNYMWSGLREGTKAILLPEILTR